VEWNRRAPTIRVAKLLVGTPLPDLDEAVRQQERHHFAWLQNGDVAHDQAT
jgi:hypothetical protein